MPIEKARQTPGVRRRLHAVVHSRRRPLPLQRSVADHPSTFDPHGRTRKLRGRCTCVGKRRMRGVTEPNFIFTFLFEARVYFIKILSFNQTYSVFVYVSRSKNDSVHFFFLCYQNGNPRQEIHKFRSGKITTLEKNQRAGVFTRGNKYLSSHCLSLPS